MTTEQEIAPNAELEELEKEEIEKDVSGDEPKEPDSQGEPVVSPTQKKNTGASKIGKPPNSYIRYPPAKAAAKKDEASKPETPSKIPLKVKPPPVPTPSLQPKPNTYRRAAPPRVNPVVNRNTLEMQFINNQKRLLQLHGDLVDKQRPLIEMHKSLLRTQKQLEAMGKKVTLENIKLVSLESGEKETEDNSAVEVALELKKFIEEALAACADVCKGCKSKRLHAVNLLENMSKSVPEDAESNIELDLEALRQEDAEIEEQIERTIRENEQKMIELVDTWQKKHSLMAINEEMAAKIAQMETVIKEQQQKIADSEANIHVVSKKYDEKRMNSEKAITDLSEKINHLEEDLKKEKKVANENLTKSRNLRNVVTGLETKVKETEDKNIEVTKKLSQLQEQLRRKEVQWLKEKDVFKKQEALLQQKLTENQTQFDSRLESLDNLKRTTEMQLELLCKSYESKLRIKDEEFIILQNEKELWDEERAKLEDDVAELKQQLACRHEDFKDYEAKISEVRATYQKQAEECTRVQHSLKTHAQLAATMKLDKDNALKEAEKLRTLLHQAREEILYKSKIISQIEEKSALYEKTCHKLKDTLKQYQTRIDNEGDRCTKNRCSVCSTGTCSFDAELGKFYSRPTSNLSDSSTTLILDKVDKLEARLDDIKSLQMPIVPRNMQFSINRSRSNDSCRTSKLGKQIELQAKLYEVLQNHADQSCEDFINLLKLTVSSSAAKGFDEGSNHLEVMSAQENYSSNLGRFRESFPRQSQSSQRYYKLYADLEENVMVHDY